jgi:arylsulfatase A-like enzyme
VQVATQIAKPLQGLTLAHQLREAGYETHSISANMLASPRRHGTETGFDSHVIVDSTLLANIPQFALTFFSDTTLPFWLPNILPGINTIDMHSHGEQNPYPPEAAYRLALELLDRPRHKPRFVWVHTMPPHDPYLPPAATKYSLLPKGELERWSEFTSMGLYPAEKQDLIDKYRLRYQESIMGADLALAEFMQQLAERGRLDKALVIVSSDHGESFERGLLGHAGNHLHNAVVQIPLVIKLPGQREGRFVDTPVSLADLAPTMLDFAQAPALPATDGRSLMPALDGQVLAPAPVYVMTMEKQSRFKPIRAGHYAVIEGNFKLVMHMPERSAELYSIDTDPLELHDLSERHPELKKRLIAQLSQRLDAAEARRQQLFSQR